MIPLAITQCLLVRDNGSMRHELVAFVPAAWAVAGATLVRDDNMCWRVIAVYATFDARTFAYRSTHARQAGPTTIAPALAPGQWRRQPVAAGAGTGGGAGGGGISSTSGARPGTHE